MDRIILFLLWLRFCKIVQMNLTFNIIYWFLYIEMRGDHDDFCNFQKLRFNTNRSRAIKFGVIRREPMGCSRNLPSKDQQAASGQAADAIKCRCGAIKAIKLHQCPMTSRVTFMQKLQPMFIKDYETKNSGKTIDIQQSHGGSLTNKRSQLPTVCKRTWEVWIKVRWSCW